MLWRKGGNKMFNWNDAFRKPGYETKIKDIEKIVTPTFLKKLRQKRNGSQRLLAKILGVSEKTIEKWEQGVNPIKGTASRLLYLLNKYDWLLDEFYVFERNDEYCQLQNDYKIKVIPTRKKIKKETNTKFVKNNDCIEINQMLYKEKSQSQQDASTSCYI